MTMWEGEHWICSNPNCRCEIVVETSASKVEGTNPKCSCGFAMRKRYRAPILTAIRLVNGSTELKETFFSQAR
jgi:hypothetical protein